MARKVRMLIGKQGLTKAEQAARFSENHDGQAIKERTDEYGSPDKYRGKEIYMLHKSYIFVP